MTLTFLLNSVGLGAGLAMDAFSVSLANGLREPRMSRRRMCAVAGVYAFFQYLMPVLGWLLVRTALELFSGLRKLIPWLALGLLLFIGGRLLLEGLRERREGPSEERIRAATPRDLALQGLATSIDALSVGLTLAEYQALEAQISALIIGAVTFGICLAGLLIGRRAGTRLSWRASVLGGCILIAVGLEIFLKGVLA